MMQPRGVLNRLIPQRPTAREMTQNRWIVAITIPVTAVSVLGAFSNAAARAQSVPILPIQTVPTRSVTVQGPAEATDIVVLDTEELEAARLDRSEAIGEVAQTLDADDLGLDPQQIENSPVLQRWLDNTPDLLRDIRTDPAFWTRVRAGYSQIDDEGGFHVGLEDVFLGRTGLTLSGDYHRVFDGDRQMWGIDLRYYALPLGNRINIAPQVGYRQIETNSDRVEGEALGLRLMFIPSRTGAADLSVTQSWVNPGSSSHEASVTTFSVGYALNQNLRISTDIELQLMPEEQDERWGLGLEWLL